MRCRSPVIEKASAWWIPVGLVLGFLATSLYTNALVRADGFQLFSIPSTSMEPSIRPGDHLIVDKRFYRSHKPATGDIAVFRHGNLLIVKRIICAGFCTVVGHDKTVLVDDEVLSEPYVIHIMDEQVVAPELANFGPVRVPDGKLFIVGDNRDVSLDSRTFGPVEASSIIGRPLYLVRPFARAGTVIH
jgi:signal peptidase I